MRVELEIELRIMCHMTRLITRDISYLITRDISHYLLTPDQPFSYTLSNGKSIQMVTALVLQLIQCIIKVPEAEEKKKEITIKEDEPVCFLIAHFYFVDYI